MGTPATRITAEDFLTPPELRNWRLASDGAGRIGGVRCELTGAASATKLGNCYQQVPLRVLPPFSFGPDQPVLLYLLNPTAGLMDGDGQLVEVDAQAGTHAVVMGQSATRIHPSWQGFSTQQWRISVGPDAVLVLLPGPTIPFGGCRYYQRAQIDLAPTGSLIWGDIWLAGRYARGAVSEQFQFKTVVQDLTVRRQGRLVYRDRFAWHGPWNAVTARWHFGAGPACGSLLVAGPQSHRVLTRLEAAPHAVLPTAAGDLCCRWQGTSEAVTGAVVSAALHAAPLLAGSSPASAWLLTRGQLAPSHWFSFSAPGPAELR
jgi:urease accessory protein